MVATATPYRRPPGGEREARVVDEEIPSSEGLTTVVGTRRVHPLEQLFAHYVRQYVSPDIAVGSLLRGYSELKIAQLFVDHGWGRFGHAFSSCNRANYQQGADNTHLSWCGDCPKCANSYLLFAPFIPAEELQQLFG